MLVLASHFNVTPFFHFFPFFVCVHYSKNYEKKRLWKKPLRLAVSITDAEGSPIFFLLAGQLFLLSRCPFLPLAFLFFFSPACSLVYSGSALFFSFFLLLQNPRLHRLFTLLDRVLSTSGVHLGTILFPGAFSCGMEEPTLHPVDVGLRGLENFDSFGQSVPLRRVWADLYVKLGVQPFARTQLG